MRWLMDLFDRLRHRDLPPPPSIDREALRDEMKRTDPEFARVSRVQHDALNAIGFSQGTDELALKRERQAWQQWGHQK